jgi:hypothetical protein
VGLQLQHEMGKGRKNAIYSDCCDFDRCRSVAFAGEQIHPDGREYSDDIECLCHRRRVYMGATGDWGVGAGEFFPVDAVTKYGHVTSRGRVPEGRSAEMRGIATGIEMQ